jgi:hypothetical protein
MPSYGGRDNSAVTTPHSLPGRSFSINTAAPQQRHRCVAPIRKATLISLTCWHIGHTPIHNTGKDSSSPAAGRSKRRSDESAQGGGRTDVVISLGVVKLGSAGLCCSSSAILVLSRASSASGLSTEFAASAADGVDWLVGPIEDPAPTAAPSDAPAMLPMMPPIPAPTIVPKNPKHASTSPNISPIVLPKGSELFLSELSCLNLALPTAAPIKMPSTAPVIPPMQPPPSPVTAAREGELDVD